MSLDFDINIDPCETCGRAAENLSWNYTHNVTPMWRLVGVYEALYESDGKRVSEILPALVCGVSVMAAKIDDCRALNPENGWGDADRALEWLRDVTDACVRHPSATVSVSR